MTVPEHFNFAADVVERWASERPAACALWCVDQTRQHERQLSFAELGADLQRAANYFQTAGIRRGDCVLLLLPRIPEWWISMLGLIRLGAVPIPCTTLLTAKDI